MERKDVRQDPRENRVVQVTQEHDLEKCIEKESNSQYGNESDEMSLDWNVEGKEGSRWLDRTQNQRKFSWKVNRNHEECQQVA